MKPLSWLHTIDNVLKNWTDRIGFCMVSRGSHLNEIIFHYYTGGLYFQIEKKKFKEIFCSFFNAFSKKIYKFVGLCSSHVYRPLLFLTHCWCSLCNCSCKYKMLMIKCLLSIMMFLLLFLLFFVFFCCLCNYILLCSLHLCIVQ